MFIPWLNPIKNTKYISRHISITTFQQLDLLYSEGMQMALAGLSFRWCS